MKLLIVYATTDGQTRKIARAVLTAASQLGHAAELLPAADASDTDPTQYDAAILAGSLHAGGYQKTLATFAHDRAAALNHMPTLFLAVSLSAAGKDADDWKGVEEILAEFKQATGWTPGRVEHVAGAYKPSEYDVFRGWAMRRILAVRDPSADPGIDEEYTDWPKLAAAVEHWLEDVSRQAAA